VLPAYPKAGATPMPFGRPLDVGRTGSRALRVGASRGPRRTCWSGASPPCCGCREPGHAMRPAPTRVEARRAASAAVSGSPRRSLGNAAGGQVLT